MSPLLPWLVGGLYLGRKAKVRHKQKMLSRASRGSSASFALPPLFRHAAACCLRNAAPLPQGEEHPPFVAARFLQPQGERGQALSPHELLPCAPSPRSQPSGDSVCSQGLPVSPVLPTHLLSRGHRAPPGCPAQPLLRTQHYLQALNLDFPSLCTKGISLSPPEHPFSG